MVMEDKLNLAFLNVLYFVQAVSVLTQFLILLMFCVYVLCSVRKECAVVTT